jgi:ribose transport system substrate-binding protein
LKQAATALGWKFVSLTTTDGTSASIDAAWSQIDTAKPTIAVNQGVDPSEILPYLKKAAANGTYIVGDGIPSADGSPTSFIDQNALDASHQGAAMAAWVVADAAKRGDKSPQVLLANAPDFPILSAIGGGFQNGYKKLCPGCSITHLNLGLTNLTAAPEDVISALRSHPGIKYVVYTAGNLFDAVGPALKSAGITGIRVISDVPDSTGLAQLKSGMITAAVAFPYYEEAYFAIDAGARHVAGVPEPKYGGLPVWVLTAKTVPSTGIFPVVVNFVSKMKHLWGLG